MPRKALRVQIELDIQAVTCPGVWLCPNGKVSLQIYMLDSCIQTTALAPVFPLLYHEQFIFYKTFHTAHTLVDLQRLIDKDFLYAELLQWPNRDIGNVIASFQTSLHEVLYPSSMEGTLSGVDVDLLMEPTKNFPGIIAPKIEISTRTTVEEILCPNDRAKSSHHVVNPKTILSNSVPRDFKRTNKLPRQKRVCHSVEYHKLRKCVNSRSLDIKPPFLVRKPEEDLSWRRPRSTNDNFLNKPLQVRGLDLSPRRTYKSNPKAFADVPSEYSTSGRKLHPEIRCLCGSGHSVDDCGVCTKYSSYFNNGETIDACCRNTDAFVRKVNSGSINYANETTEDGGYCKHFASAQTNEMKQQGYLESSLCNNKYCVRCTPSRKPKGARQIHDRLVRTLDFCSPVNNCDEEQNIDFDSFTACYSQK